MGGNKGDAEDVSMNNVEYENGNQNVDKDVNQEIGGVKEEMDKQVDWVLQTNNDEDVNQNEATPGSSKEHFFKWISRDSMNFYGLQEVGISLQEWTFPWIEIQKTRRQTSRRKKEDNKD